MVAVKEVSHVDLQDDIAQQHWEQEIQALDRLNELKQDHIVRFLTAFSRYRQGGRDFYLIMEWADGGNLRELWQKYPRPLLNTSLIKASFRELHGLATALLAAHYPEKSGTSYRLGNLRPENILRFCGTDIIGTLKISDWGQARIITTHSVTSLRNTSTLRYEAPEMGTQSSIRHADHGIIRRSRLSDIWSLGCIMLEFIIWLLYGAEGLERFENELPPGSSFYQLAEDRYGSAPVINTVVVKWMNSMADHFACEPGSALGRLLELVKTGLLVVKLPRQIEMTDETWTILAEASREVFASPDLPSIVISQNDPVNLRQKSGLALDTKPNPEPARLTALEFERIIQGIFSQHAATDEYWLPDATRPPAPTQEFLDKNKHHQDTEHLVGQEPVVSLTERDVTFPWPERVSSSSVSLSA
jgi:serine/threonine protein kinase